MPPRRVHAPLEPAPPEREAADHAPPPPPEPAREETLEGQAAALQRSAGNAAATKLLRDAAPGAPLDVATMTKRYTEQLRREEATLDATVVPQLLQRLVPTGQVGTSETLAELTLMAREELERSLNRAKLPWEGPVRVVSQVADIQQTIVRIAGQRNLIIPGHRSADDAAGLEKEAKALAGLSGLKLPDLAIEASAAGFKFRFDGELTVAGRGVTVKGGAGGGEVEGKAGPVKGSAAVGKDGAKVAVKVAHGAVELKGDITAKPDGKTSWSIGLEITFGGGAAAVPDPAKLAGLIQTAGETVTAAAEYVGSAVAGGADVSADAVKGKLKPAAEGIGKVAEYVEKHKAKPAGSTGATLGVTAKGDDAGGASAMVTLTISF